MGEFAAFHRQRQPGAHDRQHACDDLAIVDLGELGKPRPLGDDQPDHVLAARAVDFVHEQVDDHLDHGPNGQIAQRRRLDRAHQRAQHRAHEFLEQALLVAEVEVDRALGDAGAAGDVVEPGGGKASRGKLLERGGENGRAPFVPARRTRPPPPRGSASAPGAAPSRTAEVVDHAAPSK